jgi:hypothetical protein
MAGLVHIRLKDGVASFAYAIHVYKTSAAKTWMPGTSPGMTA